MGSTPVDQSRVRCKLKNWWEADGVMALSKEFFGDQDGSHATCGEVSLTQYAYPHSIKQAEMDPPVAPTGPIYDAADYRRRFPDPASAPPLKSKPLELFQPRQATARPPR